MLTRSGVVLEAAAGEDHGLLGLDGDLAVGGLGDGAADLAAVGRELRGAGAVAHAQAELGLERLEGLPQRLVAHAALAGVVAARLGTGHVGELGAGDGGLGGGGADGGEPLGVLGDLLGPGLHQVVSHAVLGVQVALVLEGALDGARAEDDLAGDAGVAALPALGGRLDHEDVAQVLGGRGDGGGSAGPAVAHDQDLTLVVPGALGLTGLGDGGTEPGGDGRGGARGAGGLDEHAAVHCCGVVHTYPPCVVAPGLQRAHSL